VKKYLNWDLGNAAYHLKNGNDFLLIIILNLTHIDVSLYIISSLSSGASVPFSMFVESDL
jgi:hypothetical protein